MYMVKINNNHPRFIIYLFSDHSLLSHRLAGGGFMRYEGLAVAFTAFAQNLPIRHEPFSEPYE